jgi:hypothetical protein
MSMKEIAFYLSALVIVSLMSMSYDTHADGGISIRNDLGVKSVAVSPPDAGVTVSEVVTDVVALKKAADAGDKTTLYLEPVVRRRA